VTWGLALAQKRASLKSSYDHLHTEYMNT
jgi:hypothetical protein